MKISPTSVLSPSLVTRVQVGVVASLEIACRWHSLFSCESIIVQVGVVASLEIACRWRNLFSFESIVGKI